MNSTGELYALQHSSTIPLRKAVAAIKERSGGEPPALKEEYTYTAMRGSPA